MAKQNHIYETIDAQRKNLRNSFGMVSRKTTVGELNPSPAEPGYAGSALFTIQYLNYQQPGSSNLIG